MQYAGTQGSGCSEVWDPATGALTRFYDSCSWGKLGFAGDRVGWVFGPNSGGGSDGWAIKTATLSAPKIVDAGYVCCTRPMSDIVDSGPVFVVGRWGPCRISLDPPCAHEPKQNGELFRFDGTSAIKIASSTGPLTPLSVDAGRILVDHENGTLELLDQNGATLHTYTLNAAALRGARLQGNDLVVQTATAIEITDAYTGAFLRRWPLPTTDATLVDLQDGAAVLVAGTDIHLLQLAEGTDKVIHTAADNGPVLAQLEPAGLCYSYTTNDPNYPGRVVFVPFNQLNLGG